jgi:ankyrin repeat protein
MEEEQNKKKKKKQRQQLLASFKTMQAARGRGRNSNNASSSSILSVSLNAVSCRSSSGMTPLSYACRNGDYDMVAVLLDAGADVFRSDDFGYTALHHAADCEKDGAADIVELLLDKGADVHATSYNGSTALHCASAAGSLQAAYVLLDYGARLQETNGHGKTSLQVARSAHTKVALESYSLELAAADGGQARGSTSSPVSQNRLMREKVKVVIAQIDELLRGTQSLRATCSPNSHGSNNQNENNTSFLPTMKRGGSSSLSRPAVSE